MINYLNMKVQGKISVEGILEAETCDFMTDTCRPDIFQKGHFSVFDVLRSLVDIKYHFDDELKTHVIDELNEHGNWWYSAIYHGGGRLEEPFIRMDTMPYKKNMRISFYERSLDDVYSSFRLKDGLVEVKVDDDMFNVDVVPHNLRNDIFQNDVVTAIDTVLSLSEQHDVSVDITWKEVYGSAVVQSYWVTGIGDKKAKDLAGFLYECGDRKFISGGKFGGNRIHINSDIRVIDKAGYSHWNWINLRK